MIYTLYRLPLLKVGAINIVYAKYNIVNTIIITMSTLNIFIKLQYNEVSDAGHCIVVPKNPKIPDPIIPPFPPELFPFPPLAIFI